MSMHKDSGPSICMSVRSWGSQNCEGGGQGTRIGKGGPWGGQKCDGGAKAGRWGSWRTGRMGWPARGHPSAGTHRYASVGQGHGSGGGMGAWARGGTTVGELGGLV